MSICHLCVCKVKLTTQSKLGLLAIFWWRKERGFTQISVLIMTVMISSDEPVMKWEAVEKYNEERLEYIFIINYCPMCVSDSYEQAFSYLN